MTDFLFLIHGKHLTIYSVSRELPPLEDIAGIDTDALELSVATLGKTYMRKTGKVEQSPKPLSPKE